MIGGGKNCKRHLGENAEEEWNGGGQEVCFSPPVCLCVCVCAFACLCLRVVCLCVYVFACLCVMWWYILYDVCVYDVLLV
jgi:hypothetical protein